MKRNELRSKLAALVQDPSYTNDQLNDYLYRADQETCRKVLLPSFKRIGSITTEEGQPYVSLTTLTNGFSGKLTRIHKVGVTVYPNLESLIDYYMVTDNEDLTAAGEVEAVAQEGTNLWYQKVPTTAETLIMTYYQNPPAWSSDSYEPSHIPEDIQYKVLINGAAYYLYSEIEDDVDDVKINTTVNFNASFNDEKPWSGINDLRSWVARTRTPHISSSWSY